MPLRGVAAQFAEAIQGFLILHTFGHYLELQVVREIDAGAHDGGVVIVAHHADDEGLVDLDGIDRQLLQVGQRGVAGSEIVNGDPQTHR